MRIRIEHDGTVFEFECRPMPEGRFRALCSLVLTAIIGAVLLGLVHILGVWGIVWPIGALVLYWFHQGIKAMCR